VSHHPSDRNGEALIEIIQKTIEAAIPKSSAQVTGGGGHFSIIVVSEQFSGKNMLQQQRLVYSAISNLMKGSEAPVHAIDSLQTRTP